jgi:hypothetical protein
MNMRNSMLRLGAMLLACCASGALAQTSSEPTVVVAPTVATADPNAIVIEQDTLVRLMVLNEVSTRSAQPGDRFVLRVDAPVVVNGVTVIPAGTKAWGEVLDAEKSGGVGRAGKLNAKLLYLEHGGARIPISGQRQSAGESGTTQVVAGAIALGPLALLAPGNSARLKAGEIFSAYVETAMIYDPATSTLTPVVANGAAGPKQQ